VVAHALDEGKRLAEVRENHAGYAETYREQNRHLAGIRGELAGICKALEQRG
jgi:hypothetical protein